ncbi:tRNA lysidine(34) synthetase TilS [bacterium]|nr:tRNA lysidine(34) synthetase TilS [bacterium]NCQ55514.1 tRNA lysidine(34) synthetase TilS [Candidatus Parcubacteria bacterium]NCS67525.1 tRNA lysidine(34) synthetase TilS [Candidatus Peregrinibacteria bacterium]NCS96310.1 tRNA lysidine(34) synthetase TilS [bacterium]
MKSPSPIEAFKSFIESNKLESQKLILMVSGGVDSMVLLDIAAQVIDKSKLAVFHLNHNARAEAKADQIFVQNICTKYKIQFYTETLSTNFQASERNWRNERIRLSQLAAADFAATRILTAHHATDLVETMIHRLTKGAGAGGLSPFDISTKPFWEISKSELVDFANENGIEWQEDCTNLNTKFERNLIRAEVLPALRSITPNLEAVFVREAKTFAELQNFLEMQLQTQLSEAFKKHSLDLSKFRETHPALQSEFLRTIALKTPSQSEIEDCLKWLLGNPEGNSKKSIGGTEVKLKENQLRW